MALLCVSYIFDVIAVPTFYGRVWGVTTSHSNENCLSTKIQTLGHRVRWYIGYIIEKKLVSILKASDDGGGAEGHGPSTISLELIESTICTC